MTSLQSAESSPTILDVNSSYAAARPTPSSRRGVRTFRGQGPVRRATRSGPDPVPHPWDRPTTVLRDDRGRGESCQMRMRPALIVVIVFHSGARRRGPTGKDEDARP